MDGIESVGMLPGQSAAALREMDTATRSTNLATVTPEAVADMSDLKKQELAKDFESLILTRLFEEVKESISASSFDEDAGSEQIHGMFWSFLAEDVAHKGGFGLWQDFYQHFKEMDGSGTTGTLMDKEL